MKVYVLLFWFYEGDSNLVNSFRGVFYSHAQALKSMKLKKGEVLLTSEERESKENEWGGNYGDPSFYEIRECSIELPHHTDVPNMINLCNVCLNLNLDEIDKNSMQRMFYNCKTNNKIK